jgi:hypothetical protein
VIVLSQRDVREGQKIRVGSGNNEKTEAAKARPRPVLEKRTLSEYRAYLVTRPVAVTMRILALVYSGRSVSCGSRSTFSRT